MLKSLGFAFFSTVFGALLVWSAMRAQEQAPYARKNVVTSYRVLILPICNPGFSCDPAVPRQLEQLFFRHENGVAAFIKNLSRGQARIVGHATDWMRPSHKHKSIQHVLDHRDELLALGNDNALFDTYDMVFLYTTMSGPAAEKSFTRDQLDVAELQGLQPGLAIMINAPVFGKSTPKIPKSAILPSTSWAHEVLHVMGLTNKPWSLTCAQKTDIASCLMEQSTDDGTMAPPAFLRRAMKWTTTPVKLVSQNGIYRIDSASRSTPGALEVKLPRPLRLNNTTSFDRVFVEPKTYGSLEKLFPSHDPKDKGSRLESIFDHAFIYLSNGDDEPTISLLKRPTNEEITFPSLKEKPQLELFNTAITMTIVKSDSTSLAVKIEGL